MSYFGWYALTFPADLSPDAVTGFMRSLAARGRKGWLGGGRTILFETEHTGQHWQWRLGVRRDDAASVLRLLRAHLPQIAYEPIEVPRPLISRGVELRLRSPLRSVRVDQGESAASTVLGTMTGIGKDETIVVQWVVGPWLPRSPVPNPSDRPSPGMPWELFTPGIALDAEATQALRRKQGEPIFGVVGRVAVQAAGRSRQEQLMRRVFNGLQVLREPIAAGVRTGVGVRPSPEGRRFDRDRPQTARRRRGDLSEPTRFAGAASARRAPSSAGARSDWFR